MEYWVFWECRQFWSDVAATVFGGILFTVVLFFVREKVLPVPRLDGVWDVCTVTNDATLDGYRGMKLRYRVMLWQSGNELRGTAEKIGEECLNQPPVEYRGERRTRSLIDGAIQKNYLSRSIITLHFVDSGMRRQTTTFFRIKKRIGRIILEGSFESTAADASGHSTWTRPKRR
jgi:hypothetical protein